MTSTKGIKRHRDALSPQPILDRIALLTALQSNQISLRNPERQLDLFYQLLHRRGYPPLPDLLNELSRGHSENIVSTKIPQLSQSFLDFLSSQCRLENDGFVTLTSKIQMHQTSSNGNTIKIVVELQDGHVVESVLMNHEGSRTTLCVSSQVGCAMGCTFCATGTMGIRGNLSSGEILEQLVHASRILKTLSINNHDTIRTDKKGKCHHDIRNVVFMGMGEPLNNYPNVLSACRAMIDRRLWNLSYNRVTVSTVGVTSRMRDLTRDLPEVNLALSLHAPNQRLREKIVPAAKGTPIEALIEALDEHSTAWKRRRQGENPQENGEHESLTSREARQMITKRKRAMIEYVMLDGETSTLEAAHQLGKLCEGRHLVVNLIPYNKTDVRDELSCPDEKHMQEFRRIVSSYGSFCSIRRTMGADIAGACGQLVVAQEKQLYSTLDIEEDPLTRNRSGKAQSVRQNRVRSKKLNEDRSYDDALRKSKEGNIDKMIRCLTIATTVATSCFVVSTVLMFARRWKR